MIQDPEKGDMKWPEEKPTLPWRVGDDEKHFVVDNENKPVAQFVFWYERDFAIHAANTYHEREQLLRECLTVIGEFEASDRESQGGCRDCGTVSVYPHEKGCRIQELLNEIRESLAT